MFQAPESMKSVVQAAWLLTVAFGNLIVIVIAELRALTQANEFFMFACLMLVDMGFFTWLAVMYGFVFIVSYYRQLSADIKII